MRCNTKERIIRSIIVVVIFGYAFCCICEEGHVFADEMQATSDNSKENSQVILNKLSEKSNKNIRKQTINNLLSQGDEGIAILIEGLHNDDLYVQMSCIMALGEIKSVKAEEPLINKLNSEYQGIVIPAVSALGKIKGVNTFNALHEILNSSKNKEIIKSVLIALGELDDVRGVQVILEYIEKENDSYSKSLAYLSLAKLGHSDVRNQAYNAIMQSEHIGVIEIAILTLGYSGNKDDYQFLKEKLSDDKFVQRSWGINRTIKISVAMLEMKYGNLSENEKIQYLGVLLNENEVEIRKYAIDELSKINSKESMEHIKKIADNVMDPLHNFAKLHTNDN